MTLTRILSKFRCKMGFVSIYWEKYLLFFVAYFLFEAASCVFIYLFYFIYVFHIFIYLLKQLIIGLVLCVLLYIFI